MDPANDTRPTPAAAAACSDRDLARIVYQAIEGLQRRAASDWGHGTTLDDDEIVRQVTWGLKYDGYGAESCEHILWMAEQMKPQVEKARTASRLAAFEKLLGKRYAGCTLDNFEAGWPEQQAALTKLRAYAGDIRANVDRGRGLVLFGPAGSGKDHLAAAVGREAIIRGVTVSWRNGRDIFGAFRDAMDNDTSERSLFRELEAPEVLVLSDPIPPFGRLTEYQGDVLFRLVDSRYRQLKPTWATLNVCGGDEADNRIGAQIADRLRHDALAIFCDWPSYRKVSA